MTAKLTTYDFLLEYPGFTDDEARILVRATGRDGFVVNSKPPPYKKDPKGFIAWQVLAGNLAPARLNVAALMMLDNNEKALYERLDKKVTTVATALMALEPSMRWNMWSFHNDQDAARKKIAEYLEKEGKSAGPRAPRGPSRADWEAAGQERLLKGRRENPRRMHKNPLTHPEILRKYGSYGAYFDSPEGQAEAAERKRLADLAKRDPRVVAIRADKKVGRGSCSSIDEAMEDREVVAALDAAGITSVTGALGWAYAAEAHHIDQWLDAEPDNEGLREELKASRRALTRKNPGGERVEVPVVLTTKAVFKEYGVTPPHDWPPTSLPGKKAILARAWSGDAYPITLTQQQKAAFIELAEQVSVNVDVTHDRFKTGKGLLADRRAFERYRDQYGAAQWFLSKYA